MTARRLSAGGRIDRNQPLKMQFDGKPLAAFQGDTLAAALLANGHGMVARSFKYHRPRGVMAAGVEEANALVHLREGDRHEPNAQATTVEAFDGLVSSAQNAWPSLAFDISAMNGLLSRFFGAGFYYKTFIGPFKGTGFWMACEKIIRHAAGMGRATTLDDPDSYEKINAFCDVLVIGAGPAGLAAALTAGRQGAQVILVEQDFDLGGALLSHPLGAASDQWLAGMVSALQALPNVKILRRTTAFGAYDSAVFGCVERLQDHLIAPEDGKPRQRQWQIRTGRAIIATGAIERPFVFAGNDLPGVILCSAARRYLNRHAILLGGRMVIATNNDSAYPVAVEQARAGAKVTLCDLRPRAPSHWISELRSAGVELRTATAVLKAVGRRHVKAAILVPVDPAGRTVGKGRTIPCDALALSAGWAPALHLWSQRFGKPDFHAELDAFLPAAERGSLICAGSVMAANSTEQAVLQGHQAAGADGDPRTLLPPASDTPDDFWGRDLLAVSVITQADGSTPGKAFVDFQHDVKLADIDQAHQEGYVSVEHLKRYTTSGMAADQGKTSNLNALARMARLRGLDIPQVGTTTFRPPYTPVSIGAIVGHEHGLHFRPTRHSTIHDWHVEKGATLIEAGAWLRPWYYGQPGESLRDAYVREAAHVRTHVCMIDVSTLGKIAVQGPDAAEFLDRVYANGFKTLAIGKLRYGIMLREDGFVLDDGATARLGEHDYFMSTTTANAAKVLAQSEHLLQTAWRDLKVHVTTVTDQWAAIAIAGPKSRAVLQAATQANLSREVLANNHFTDVTVEGIRCRLHRMSYSGELAYELYIPARSGRKVWEALFAAGRPHDLRPYGTEAMGALRIEKGHVAGAEIEGRTTLKDLGMEGLASRKKPFIGSVLRQRELLADADRPTLVGLEVIGDTGAKAGSLLFSEAGEAKGHGEGWVSSTTYSPALKRNIALGLLARGNTRIGETLRIVNPLDNQILRAKVVSHHFFDPEGSRQNG